MRLLITGGTGFFGKALLRHFHEEARLSPLGRPSKFYEVIVVSRTPESFAHRYPTLSSAPWLSWVRADVCSAPSLDSLRGLGALDAILHAATDSTNSHHLSPIEKIDQIVDGTRNMLEIAVELQASRFFLSSYG